MSRILKCCIALLAVILLCAESYAMEIQDYSEDIAWEKNGERVVFQQKRGFWSYEGKGLSVEIQRFRDAKKFLIYYVADIKFKEDHRMKSFFADPEKVGRAFLPVEQMARNNKLVLAINDDMVGYRIYQQRTVGYVVRDGKVISNESYKKETPVLPNLDTMTFEKDGTMKVFSALEHTAEDFVKMGYRDVFSFGPYIIQNSKMNPLIEKRYDRPEARTVIGMVNKNHYVVFTCEGRRPEVSIGTTLKWVAELLLKKGVTTAFNFDGGGSTALVFMGIRLDSYNPKGHIRSGRKLSGILGIGRSDLVPRWEKK